MAKRIQEMVRVALQRDGAAPAAFVWRGKRYVIRHVEAVWKEMGPWWDGDGERTCFRVTAAEGSGFNQGSGFRVQGSGPGIRSLGFRSGAYGAGGGIGARKEASSPPGIYDLCLNEATGDWTIMWVVD